jgi:D-alanyl-D-alanine carboxypeptidase
MERKHLVRRKQAAVALVLQSLLFCSAAHGQKAGSAAFSDKIVQELDAAIAKQMQDANLPGVVVAVWVPGEGEYVAVKGTANLETARPRHLNDPFRIASITKTFIATAILRLSDEGKLSVNDKLSRWYPDFPNADKITVDDLLRMRSGIADSADQAFLESYFKDPLANITADEMIRRAASKAAQFEAPGQKTRYVNVNYMLLAEIIRKLSGNDLNRQLFRSVLQPLGMKNTSYPVKDNLPGNLHGYALNPQSGKFVDKTILNPAPAGGAGAIISTIADLRIYAKALWAGTLLKPETQRARLEMMPFEGGSGLVKYGEGIGALGRFFGHNGTIFGFSSEMWYLPEKDAVIVINVNRLDVDDASKSDSLLLSVSKILFPEYVSW